MSHTPGFAAAEAAFPISSFIIVRGLKLLAEMDSFLRTVRACLRFAYWFIFIYSKEQRKNKKGVFYSQKKKKQVQQKTLEYLSRGTREYTTLGFVFRLTRRVF